MAFPSNSMDFSTTFRSERFRTPFTIEKKLGLWVDRIGQGVDNYSDIKEMRILGLYGAVFIEKGNGVFTTATEGEHKVYTGTIMLLFPDEPHRYIPETSWKTKWIVWGGPEGDILEKTGFLNKAKPVIRESAELFSHAFEQLEPIMNQEDTGTALLRKNVLLAFVHGIFTQSAGKSTTNELSVRIRESVNLIQSSIAYPPSVSELAKHANMSETNFRRLFRRITGRTPSRFIISLRISEAKRLLAMGRSIKETALALGYDDMFYFMRVFKREVGIPPGEFSRTVGTA